MTDTRELHEKSLQDWNSVAPAWATYQDAIARKFGVVSEWMIDRLELGSARSVLELACGAGELSVRIADALPPEAVLVCSDFAPEMVRATAQRLGGRNAAVRELDAQALALEDADADRVACRFGFMLMPEPDKAFAECRRVLVPGGRLVGAVWGGLERNAWLMVFGGAMMEQGHPPPGDPFGPGGMFSLADPAVLEGRLKVAGFVDVAVEAIEFDYSFENFDEFWDMQSQIAGGAARMLQSLPAGTRDAIKATARASSEQFRSDEIFSFPATALGFVAKT